MDGPVWTEQRKFCMLHLRKMGFGGDLMERLISEEVNDLMLDIKKRCEVCISFHKYKGRENTFLNCVGWSTN